MPPTLEPPAFFPPPDSGGALEPNFAGRVVHSRSGITIAGVKVVGFLVSSSEPRARHASEASLGTTMTDEAGIFTFNAGDALRLRLCEFTCDLGTRLLFRAVDLDGSLLGESGLIDQTAARGLVTIELEHGRLPEPAVLEALSRFMMASRRVRISDLAGDLKAPSLDSPVRHLAVSARLALLTKLVEGAVVVGNSRDGHPGAADLGLLSDPRFLDPLSVRQGRLSVDPKAAVPGGWTPRREGDAEVKWPIIGDLPWAISDEETYRDYLRGVFVLYAHQQAVGFSGDLTQWTSIIEDQLLHRFFQDFQTHSRKATPLNRLLIPIVTRILTAATGSSFGFGLSPASLPAQGTKSDREQLDALLVLSKIPTREFENRYRLRLQEPDSVLSSPIALNVHTLKRILCDTAQGPVEILAIEPQLPGHEKQPILWETVVGVAPFFLRFEEWLDRQKPFYPENLFSLRAQIAGFQYGEPWLDTGTRAYLTMQLTPPGNVSGYAPHFVRTSEVAHSAAFLLAFGAADAKLLELLAAYDNGEYPKALRLCVEVTTLLDAARKLIVPATGEDWSPDETPNLNFPRALSFARRRRLPVNDIGQLVDPGPGDPHPRGLERFFDLPRIGFGYDEWARDLVRFINARALATRLVRYQKCFVVPVLRALCLLETADYVGASDGLASVSGFLVGFARSDGAPGVATVGKSLAALDMVYREGFLPYTARLRYDSRRVQPPVALEGQAELAATDLHRVDERYVRLLHAESLLRWGEVLYRSDEPASLERARELYKAVLFLHGEDPGTMGYQLPALRPVDPVAAENPRRRAQVQRARLGLFQLEAGLNFYGYGDDLVPTLRYSTLIAAAERFCNGSKAAQSDFINYMTRLEQLELDILSARAQHKKAQAYLQIASEQVEIAKAGELVAKGLVKDVHARIDAKVKENADADSFFSQVKDYFKGMKDTVSSIVDVGKGAQSGATELGITTDAEIKVATKQLGSEALMGVGMGGVAVVGVMGAWAAISYVTLEGMADASNKRAAELNKLTGEVLPAAEAILHVQGRQVAISQLQQSIADAELSYTTDLLAFHGERFLNRDFWISLAQVARAAMRRQLDLAAQASWFSERALAYELARPVRIIRLDYFDARLRDVTGIDRLMLDLAELRALRLGASRQKVPIRRTYSLARDFPLAYGALKATGRCRFRVSESDLDFAHPGTFAHRLRAVTGAAEAPGSFSPPRGILSNQGISFVQRAPTDASQPLVRFGDALPISEFRVRDDMGVFDMPGEHLMPFEGSGFGTTWDLEFPLEGKATGFSALSDVLITFDVLSEYDGRAGAGLSGAKSGSIFLSALSFDTTGMTSLRDKTKTGTVRFPLRQLSIPGLSEGALLTNVAVLLPGIDSGTVQATLRLVKSGTAVPFTLEDGLAMSNGTHLSDGVPGNAQPLNGAVGESVMQTFEIEIDKSGPSALKTELRDIVLWVEYQHAIA